MRFARAAVLGILALLAFPSQLSVGATTPSRAEAENRIEAVDLENRFEIALIYGDKKTVGELLADNATYVLEFVMAGPPNSANPYWTTLFSKPEFITGFGFTPDMFPSLDDSSRKFLFRDGSFVVSVRGVQQVWGGSFCAGICVSMGTSASVYMTVVWTETATGWRVTFFGTAPAGAPLAISKSQVN